MSKAFWNGVLSRLPDFCKNMGKTAMLGMMVSQQNSHKHCCHGSIWGARMSMGLGMTPASYWGGLYGQQSSLYSQSSLGDLSQSGLYQGQSGSLTGATLRDTDFEQRIAQIYNADNIATSQPAPENPKTDAEQEEA